MALFSRFHAQYVSWLQNTPLPINEPNTSTIFQTWQEFDESTQQWEQVNSLEPESTSSQNLSQPNNPTSRLVLATWNVDSMSALPESRISAIISHITNQTPAVNIIFLQEISLAALEFLLTDSRIREGWFLSDADATNWKGQSFASLTLIAKSRFTVRQSPAVVGKLTLGPVWRVKYPSRFGRDALCCDILIPSSHSASSHTRIRLVNVHLDSLPMNPSLRPRQISIIASFLRSAGRGLVAGDFNPVLPEDETLVRENDLVDPWTELYPADPGFTWGIDGKAAFPPIRLDKVAVLGLSVREMAVMHPDVIIKPDERLQTVGSSLILQREGDELVPWSDHSGLVCSFELSEE